jgi:hypothetical protein
MDIQKEYLMTDYPSGVNLQQEVTVSVGPVFNTYTYDWLYLRNLRSTWTLITDCPYGTYVQQVTDHVVPIFKNTYDRLSTWEQCSTRES